MQFSDTVGEFFYQDDDVPRGLKTNHQVFVEIDPITSGFKTDFQGAKKVAKEMPVYNGRALGMAIDGNGFTMLPVDFPEIDFTNEEDILRRYYPAVAEFVRQATGAYKVACFDHVVRHSDGTRAYERKGDVVVGGPGLAVHGDYAQEGAPKRLANFFKKPGNNDTFRKINGDQPLLDPLEYEDLKNRRFAFINVWRNIADYPVYDTPLAMIDSTTLSATAEDIVTIEFRYVDVTIETYLGGYNPSHRWVYYPLLQKHEAILLKTYDSQGSLWKHDPNYQPYHPEEAPVPSSFAIHSAFRDRNAPPDAPKRRSCEVRTVVFY